MVLQKQGVPPLDSFSRVPSIVPYLPTRLLIESISLLGMAKVDENLLSACMSLPAASQDEHEMPPPSSAAIVEPAAPMEVWWSDDVMAPKAEKARLPSIVMERGESHEEASEVTFRPDPPTPRQRLARPV